MYVRLVPKIVRKKPEPEKTVGANDVEVAGKYPVYPRPYYLTRTEGGTCRGYVWIGPGLIYRVTPTADGFDIERLQYGGSVNEKIISARRYEINEDLEVTRL